MENTLQGQLKCWRRYWHQNPETGFESVKTSDYVANLLRTLGLQVHRGIGGTGPVANLAVRDEKRAIGLRADRDALNITEHAPVREHASCTAGKCMRASTFATCSGGIMASEDHFVIHGRARGTIDSRHGGTSSCRILTGIDFAAGTLLCLA